MSLDNGHNDFEVFRNYYTGKMKADEKAAFEKNLANDPFAQDAYDGFLAIETDFERISFIEKTNMLFKSKIGLEETTTVFPFKAALGIAASIVLLIGSVFIVQNNFKNNSTDEIAKNEQKIEEEVIATQDKTTGVDVMENESIWNESLLSTDNAEQEAVLVEDEAEEVKEVKAPKITPVEINNRTEEKQVKKTVEKAEKQIDFDQYRKKQKTTAANTKETVEESKAGVNSQSQFNSLAYEDNEIQNNDNSTKIISDYKAGIVAYNQSNYNDAIQSFNKSVNDNKNVNSANYYIGMSYFNLGKTNKAINSFDKVIESGSTFAKDAQWHKALSLLNKGQYDKAKIELQSIIDSGSSYKSKAQKKLNTL